MTYEDIERQIRNGELRRLRTGVYAHVVDDGRSAAGGRDIPSFEAARRGHVELVRAAA